VRIIAPQGVALISLIVQFISVFSRSDSTYNVAKSILLKIAKKHNSSFHPCINFFVANINYEEETGTVSNQIKDI
jgi:hypothetical protein